MRRVSIAAAIFFLPVLALVSFAGTSRPLSPDAASAGAKMAKAGGAAAGAGDVVVLPNGMRVLFLEAHSNPMVASTVAVLSGVSNETTATNGAAHFLEHLLFNGTTTRTQKQLYDDADLIGGYNNATTRDEYTLFQFLVHRDFLDKALDIQSDMLFNSTIPQEMFEKERGIVLEEMAREESDPAYGAGLYFRRCWFGRDPRAMPVLGTSASIKSMTREAVFDHYRRLYRPDRMVLFLAGDFDRTAALALVKKTFGAAGSRANREGREKSGGPRPEPAAVRAGLYRRRIDGQHGYLHLAIPAPGVGDPDAAAIRAVADLLGGRPGSRLARALMGTEGSLVVSASASYVPGPSRGRLEIEATLAPEANGTEAAAAMMRELARLASEAVPAEELRGVVAAEKTDVLYLRDQIHYLGMQIAPDLVLGPGPSLGIGDGELSLLTPQNLRAAAERWLAAKPVVAVSSPAVPEGVDEAAAGPLPAAATTVAGAAPEGAEQGSGPGGRAAGAGSVRRPVQRLVFENGLTLLVAENPDSPIFAAHLLVRDRAGLEPEGMDGIADLLHRCLPYGSQILDGEGITARLSALGARLKTVDDASIPFDDYYTSPRYSYVRFETIRENWREGLGLLYTTVEYPRLDPRDIALAVSEEIDLARKAAELPNARARELYTRTLTAGGGLSRPVTGTPITLASITPEDLRAFHARYFAPGNLILSIVSSVPAPEVVELVRTTFGTLKPGAPAAPAGAGKPQGEAGAASAPSAEVLDSSRESGPGDSGRTGKPEARGENDLPSLAAKRGGDGDRRRSRAGERAGTDAPAGGWPAADLELTRPRPASKGEPAPRPSLLADPPVTTAATRVETVAGKAQSQILLGGIFERDPDDLAPLIVTTTVLSKRVAQDLRETRGLAYSVSCTLEDFGAKSWFTASMGTRPENLEVAEAGLRDAIARFPSMQLDPREVERAVNAMRGQMAMRRMTRISQAYSLGFNEFLGRDTGFDARLDAALGAVTPADLLRVAKRYLDPTRMGTAIAR